MKFEVGREYVALNNRFYKEGTILTVKKLSWDKSYLDYKVIFENCGYVFNARLKQGHFKLYDDNTLSGLEFFYKRKGS